MFIFTCNVLGNLCANFKFDELWTMVIIWGTNQSTYDNDWVHMFRSFDVVLKICKWVELMSTCKANHTLRLTKESVAKS